ncbi:hypothetical protein A6769_19080 [Nostoc punctiforme NIES-2108]|uniref:Polysaccharide biosynthesis protein n=1 Tax=Nostoc punctiforme NIES-2108 TaxID=1356359 RepID=A0A367RHK4_NOSPU|nr:hypothetical protein A6769_19080 [Nostoc punctiforme NIES-2108]
MSVEKRAFAGTIIGTVSFTIGLLQTIILVPILIKFWGVDNYGLWLGLTALTSLLQTIDVGHQNYIGNEISKFYSSEPLKVKVILASGIRIAVILGFLELFVAILIFTFNLTGKLIGNIALQTKNQEIGLGLIILILTWLLSGSVGGILGRLYLPSGLYVRFTTWGIITRFFNIASILITVVLGGNILVACIFSSIVTLFIYVLLFWDIYKIFQHLYPFWVGGNWKIALANLSKSFFIIGVGFLLQFQNNGLALFVSGIAGVTLLPMLNTMRTLVNTFLLGTTIVTQPLIPEMIRYHAQREHEKLIGMICASWWVGGTLINLGLVLTLPLIEPIYLYWTRGQINFNWLLYLLLAWSISLKNFGNPLTVYLMGINHIQAQTTIAIVQTTIILGITSLFLAKYGLVAVGIAIVFSEIIGSVIMATIYTFIEVKGLGGNLNFTKITLAFSSVVIVGLTYISVGLYWLSPLIASIVGGIILIGLYLWQWQYLSMDVRYRLIKLFHKFTSLSYRHPT